MKTSRLVLAPAVAVALTGLAGAPAFAATDSATVPAGPLCAYDGAKQSNDPETDSQVPDASDPQATLENGQVTRDDIANKKKGIGFSGTGFTPDEKATVTVVGTDGTKYSPKEKLTVDEKGEVSGTYYFSVTEGAKVPLGEYSLYLTDLKSENDSSKVTFEVVSKASEVDKPKNDEDCGPAQAPATDDETPTKTEEPTKSQSPSESASEKPTESASEKPTDSAKPTPETSSPSPSESKKARRPAAPPKPPKTETETPEPTKTESETPTPTDTESQTSEPTDPKTAETEEPKAEEPKTDEPKTEEAPETTGSASPGTDEGKKAAADVQASLSIDPTEISSEDFLNKGIKLSVSGAQPGEKVTITVEHAQGKVDRYTMTKQADEQGKASFGVQAKVKAVLGTYNVRAQAESFDEAQGGSFTVLTNGTDVDEDGSGSSGTTNDLPRTGAEMTGLALGVGLLAVGAAAVVITRRRMNAADDPAEF